MDERKAITLEQLEIVKGYIDDKDALNIKSAEFVDSTVKLYASEDKSGEPVVELVLPEEMFLDGSKTEFVDNFVWSAEKYPKSTNPELDGKPVLVLAVKSVRTIRYSFISLESVVVELMGGDTDSTSVTVAEDVISLDVKVSEEPDNRVIVKDDGLYVGAVDTIPQWTVSTDEEVNELFSLEDTPSYGEGTLGEKNVGDIVQIMENDKPVNYIVVHKGLPSDMYDTSCDGVWVLPQDINRIGRWNSDMSNDYENTANKDIESLNLSKFSPELINIIKDVKIPYVKGKGSSGLGVLKGEEGLACRLFLLSAPEMGGSENDTMEFYLDEGSTLDYFKTESFDEVKRLRICDNGVTGVASYYMTRSPRKTNTYSAITVNMDNGTIGAANAYVNGGMRIAFILPYDTPIDGNGLVLG